MIEMTVATGIATVTIARPERRNALDHAGIIALAGAIRAAETDAACRVLAIRGKGGTFCSGRDLTEAKTGAPLEEVLAYDQAWSDVLHGLRGSAKPSVAIVEGYAVAGGFTLAMGCDLVVAERNARFGALEMRGGFPAAVNCAILSHLVGPRKALEYLLSADTFPAEHLLQAGLVNRIADGADALEQAGAEMVAGLAALEPTAVRLTKEAHRMASTMPVGEAIVMGRQLNALLMSSGRIAEARHLHDGRRRAD